MSAVLAGLTILQIVQIISSLACDGKDVTDLIDWVGKRRAEGHPDNTSLAPHHDLEAQQLIEQSAGSPEAATEVISATQILGDPHAGE